MNSYKNITYPGNSLLSLIVDTRSLQIFQKNLINVETRSLQIFQNNLINVETRSLQIIQNNLINNKCIILSIHYHLAQIQH